MGIPLPHFDVPQALDGSLRHTCQCMSPLDRGLTEKALKGVWDSVASVGVDECLDWGQEALDNALCADFDDPSRLTNITKATGECYKGIREFLTTGPNLQLGPVHHQLDGVMKRLDGADGAVEWVSTEGEAIWLQMHSTPTAVASASPGKDVSSTPAFVSPLTVDDEQRSVSSLPDVNPPLARQCSMEQWLHQKLVHERHLAAEKAKLCIDLLHENDITTMNVLGAVTSEKMIAVINSASPPLTLGLQTHMMQLHEEAVKESQLGTSAATSGVIVDAAETAAKVALLEVQLEATQLEAMQTKRELEAVKKQTANIKKSDKQKPGYCGAGGGLAMMQVSESDDMQRDGSGHMSSSAITTKIHYIEANLHHLNTKNGIEESVVLETAQQQSRLKSSLFATGAQSDTL